MEHVVSIGPAGTVKAMHTDKFSLGFLGNQVIVRASDICWDEKTQSWGIHFNIDGAFVYPLPVYQGFAGYEDAREFEVAVMQECIKDELAPTDPAIVRWATRKRQ